MPWMETNHPDGGQLLDESMKIVTALQDETNPETFSVTVSNEAFVNIVNLFDKYLKYLRVDNGSMSAFWVSYIELVELLLNLLRASREGNWPLHLASIRAIIPWCFAYDRTNYARYLPWYLDNMLSLPHTHPEVHRQLQAGGFSAQLGSENPFGKIPMDQTIEETINKDTQTPGGTKGFSTKAGAVRRFYITADYRSTCIRQLREITNITKGSFTHPDMMPKRISRDELDVSSVVDMLQSN